MTDNIRELLKEIEWIRLNKPPVIGAFRWVCPICKCNKGRPHHEKCQLGQALALLKPCGTCGGSEIICNYCKKSVCECKDGINIPIPCPDCQEPAEKQGDFVAKINRLKIRDLAYSGRFLEDLIFEACAIIEGLVEKPNTNLADISSKLIDGPMEFVKGIQDVLGKELYPANATHWEQRDKYWLCNKLLKACTIIEELNEEALLLTEGVMDLDNKIADLKAKLEEAESEVLRLNDNARVTLVNLEKGKLPELVDPVYSLSVIAIGQSEQIKQLESRLAEQAAEKESK